MSGGAGTSGCASEMFGVSSLLNPYNEMVCWNSVLLIAAINPPLDCPPTFCARKRNPSLILKSGEYQRVTGAAPIDLDYRLQWTPFITPSCPLAPVMAPCCS